MITFELYRIRVLAEKSQNGQTNLLFDYEKQRPEILREIVQNCEKATLELWKIVDIENFSDENISLRIGRESTKKQEKFIDGHFQKIDDDVAYSTIVLFDIPLELCAIAHNAELTPDTSTTANKLIRILNSTKQTINSAAELEITEVPDVSLLVDYMQEAKAIKELTLTFSRPNFFDEDKMIYEPTQAALNEMNGQAGRIIFEGDELDSNKCIATTKKAAQLGEKAIAKMQFSGSDRLETMTLDKGPTKVCLSSEPNSKSEKLKAIEKIKIRFNEV
jgi:hypothetical protein